MEIIVSSASSVIGRIEAVESQIYRLQQHAEELESYNHKLKAAWGSEADDKTSYFNTSEENINNLMQIIKALKITTDQIRNYMIDMDRETNM